MQAVDGDRCVGAIVTTVICDCRQWTETGVLVLLCVNLTVTRAA